MYAQHSFTVLVTGPCATSTAALLQSVADGPVVVTELRLAPGARSTMAGVARCLVPATDVGDVGLVLLGIRAGDAATAVLEAVKREVDAVCVVIDALAADTHAAAGRTLRRLAIGISAPLVVAVHGAVDDDLARHLVRSLGVVPGGRVVPCQLGDPRSGRDVVIFTLERLLESVGTPGSGRQVA